jgi:hypothetical protein
MSRPSFEATQLSRLFSLRDRSASASPASKPGLRDPQDGLKRSNTINITFKFTHRVGRDIFVRRITRRDNLVCYREDV